MKVQGFSWMRTRHEFQFSAPIPKLSAPVSLLTPCPTGTGIVYNRLVEATPPRQTLAECCRGNIFDILSEQLDPRGDPISTEGQATSGGLRYRPGRSVYSVRTPVGHIRLLLRR